MRLQPAGRRRVSALPAPRTNVECKGPVEAEGLDLVDAAEDDEDRTEDHRRVGTHGRRARVLPWRPFLAVHEGVRCCA